MCSPRIERPCPAAIDCESFAYSSSSLNTVARGVAAGLEDVVRGRGDEDERQRDAAREGARNGERLGRISGSRGRHGAHARRIGSASVPPLTEGLSLARGSVGPVRCQARDVSANGMFQGLSLERAVSGPVR